MENYIVIDGERYDMVNVSKKTTDACDICALKIYCSLDVLCSVFAGSSISDLVGDTHCFVKHEVKKEKELCVTQK